MPKTAETVGAVRGRSGPPTDTKIPVLSEPIAMITLATASERADLPVTGFPLDTALRGTGAPLPTMAQLPLAGHPPTVPPAVPIVDLAVTIGQIGRTGTDITEISLAPEELGKLRIQMLPEGDNIRVLLSAERPETLDLLRRNIEQLAADLRQMGFATSSFGFAGWSTGHGRQGPPQTAIPDGGSTAAFTAPDAAVVNPARSGSGPASGLDLRL